MPRPQKRRARSNCWYFYTKTLDGGLCNMCKKEVRSTGNTTNLLNHLKRRHTVQYNEVVAHPEKFVVSLNDDSNSEQEDATDRKQCEAEDAVRIIEENNQSPSMEAFQADQGGTVIWLQPTQDGQPNTFQPQITIVQHSVQEDGAQQEGETILSTGEIVSSNAAVAVEQATPTNEAPKQPSADHRKIPNQISTAKTLVKSRPQLRSFANLSPMKLLKPNEQTNHLGREDTYDAFGRYVASLLRNLSSKKNACRLQKDIIWLVLQEQIRNEDC